jgi:hypothetical protein
MQQLPRVSRPRPDAHPAPFNRSTSTPLSEWMSRSRQAQWLEVDELPDRREPRSEYHGDESGHMMLRHRLKKYGMTALYTTRDGSNYFKAVHASSRGSLHASHEEWRQAVCDHIALSTNVELKQQLPAWRKRDHPVDHRVLPFVADLTGCVIIVWAAKVMKEMVFFPAEHTNDTHVLYFSWFNQTGGGALDTMEPLHPADPLGNAALQQLLQSRRQECSREGGACTHPVSNIVPTCTPVTLRQLAPEVCQRHHKRSEQGGAGDSRWGSQEDSSAELSDEQLHEFLHTYASTRPDVETAWEKTVKTPRVWCVSSQLIVKLTDEGVAAVRSWG